MMKRKIETITIFSEDVGFYTSTCYAEDEIGNKWIFRGYGSTEERAENVAENRFNAEDWSRVGELMKV